MEKISINWNTYSHCKIISTFLTSKKNLSKLSHHWTKDILNVLGPKFLRRVTWESHSRYNFAPIVTVVYGLWQLWVFVGRQGSEQHLWKKKISVSQEEKKKLPVWTESQPESDCRRSAPLLNFFSPFQPHITCQYSMPWFIISTPEIIIY